LGLLYTFHLKRKIKIMSKRSKKYKMKKPLTEAERERRKRLREQRNERQRLTDINSRRRFWKCFFLIAVIIAIGVFTAAAEIKRGSNSFIIYLMILFSCGIVCCDNSGFRSTLFSRLPDKFPFAEELKRKNKGQCRAVELCKTLSYFSLLFYPLLPTILAAVWLICEIVAFIHLIFDKDTGIRPPETPENGLSAAGDITIITSGIMLLLQMDNIFTNSRLWTFIVIFTIGATSLFLLFGSWQNSKADVIIFFLGAAAFAFSGFCAVNKDFDFSEPKKYTAVIENKYYTSGKNSHYTIYVKDWHGSEDTVSVEVSSDDYREFEIGDTVTVYEYSGALGMSYYDYSLENQ